MYPMLMAGVPCTQSSRCSFLGVLCTHSFAVPFSSVFPGQVLVSKSTLLCLQLSSLVLPRCQSAIVLLSSPYGLALHRHYPLYSESISACCFYSRYPQSFRFNSLPYSPVLLLSLHLAFGVQHSQCILPSFLSSFSFRHRFTSISTQPSSVSSTTRPLRRLLRLFIRTWVSWV